MVMDEYDKLLSPVKAMFWVITACALIGFMTIAILLVSFAKPLSNSC